MTEDSSKGTMTTAEIHLTIICYIVFTLIIIGAIIAARWDYICTKIVLGGMP